MASGLPASRVAHLRPGDASEQGAEHTRHDVGLGMREDGLRLTRVEPYPVTVRALIDLNAVPFPGDQIVAAFGALHVMRAALGFRRGLLDGGALLAEQLGVPSGEVFFLVSAG